MGVVTIEINPYKQDMKVYIDGADMSLYSAINKYRRLPFYKWSEFVLNDIYNETNDEFELIIKATPMISDILQTHVSKLDFVTSIRYEPFSNDMDTLERLVEMNEYCGGDTELRIGCYEQMEFLLNELTESGIFEETNNQTLTCNDYPGVNITISDSADHEIVFVVCDSTKNLTAYDYIRNSVVIALIPSDIDEFVMQKGNMFVFRCNGYDITDSVFEIIKEFCINSIVAEKYRQIQNDGYSEDIRIKAEQITAIEAFFAVKLPSTMNVGQTCTAEITEYLGSNTENIELKSTSGCVEVSGTSLRAVSPGRCYIEIYADGNLKTEFTQEIIITNMKLIERIAVPHNRKYISVGDEIVIDYEIIPADADNIDDITVSSANPFVVKILEGNTIKAASEGTADIKISTKETSTIVTIEVKPKMEDFFLSRYSIDVKSGETAALGFTIQPTNCLEADTIRAVSHDERIASYRGGFVVGNNPGTTTITFSAADGRIKKNCMVTVKKKGLFK